MRHFKLLLLAVLATAALLVVAVGLALALADNDDYRRAAIFLLERVTGRAVAIDGDFEADLSWEPSLTAKDLRIANEAWAEAPDLAEVGEITVQIALGPLLSGKLLVRRLVVRDSTIDLESTPDGKRSWDFDGGGQRRGGSSLIGPPIFEMINLRDVAVRYRGGESREIKRLEVAQVSLVDREEKTVVAARGTLDDREFDVSGELGSLAEALQPTRPVPVALSLRLPALDLGLEGTIEQPARGRGLNLKVTGTSDNVARIAEFFEIALPYAGRLRGEANISGDLETLSLSNLQFEIDNGDLHRLALTGRVEDLNAFRGVALQLSESMTAESEVFRVLPKELRHFNKVTWQTVLRDKEDRFVLDEVVARGTSPLGAVLDLTGEFGLAAVSIDLPISDFDIVMRLTAPTTAAVATPLSIAVPELGAISVTAEVGGVTAGPRIKTFALNIGEDGPLQIVIVGNVERVSNEQPIPFVGMDAQVSMRADRTAPVLSLWDLRPLEFGALEASWRITDRDLSHYAFDDFTLSLGPANGLDIKASGRVANVSAKSPGLIDGIELGVEFSAGSSTPVSDLLELKLPDLGRVTGTMALTGGSRAVQLGDIDLKVGTEEALRLSATGSVQSIDIGREVTAEGIDLGIAAAAPTTRDAVLATGLPLPELGPVTGTARLAGSERDLGLEEIALSVGQPDQPVVTAKGRMANLATSGERDFAGEFDVDLGRLLKRNKERQVAARGRLRGTINLSDRDGSFGIEELRVETLESERLALKIEGVFDDLEQRDDLALKTTLEVTNLRVLGALLDTDLPALGPFSFSGTVVGDDEDFRAEGFAHLGKSDLQLDLSGSLTGDRPKASGTLSSVIFYPEDFGLRPDDGPENAAPDQTTDAPAQGAVFGTDPVPFAFLREIDLSLQVALNEVRGIVLAIDQVDLNLALENGHLRLEPMEMTFYGGSLLAEAEIDARQSPPAFAIRATGDNVDIGAFLAQARGLVPVEGKADLIFDLTAQGESPRAWASSLNGRAELAVNRARVHSSLVDLPGRGLGLWLFGRSIRGYTNVDCFLAKLDIQEGDAITVALILDTPKVRSIGSGHIDLANEEVDILVQPRRKRRRLVRITTPYRIHGPLRNPEVTLTTADLAAQKFGNLILSPVNALGSLFSIVSDRGADMENPCLQE